MEEFTVTISAEWRGDTAFEFESIEDAERFRERVGEGDLEAIVEQGDINSSNVELVNFAASDVKRTR